MNKEIDVINEREIVNEYATLIINEFSKILDKNNHLTEYYKELVLLKNQLFSSSYDNHESILSILEQFKLADEYIKSI